MNSLRIFKSTESALRILCPLSSAVLVSRQSSRLPLYTNRGKFKSFYMNLSLKPVKYLSNCSLMHTSDSDASSENNNDVEKVKKVLEDQEFQSILKDFANDFGVDNETNGLLEDIRKNIDKSPKNDNPSNTNDDASPTLALSGGLHQKYVEFSDADSSVIHSYNEKYEMFEEGEPMYHISHELKPKTPYVDLKRGITGVFDIHELVQVLRNESMLDVTTISIPKQLHYADFLVIATAKSERHSEAVSELIRKLHKQKKSKKDPFLKIEGDDVPEWKAIDMGNIVLHMFLEETRILYDLESLWLFDTKFDSGGNAQADPMLKILEEQIAFFNSLQQSESPDSTKDIS